MELELESKLGFTGGYASHSLGKEGIVCCLHLYGQEGCKRFDVLQVLQVQQVQEAW